jgi:hypothetical protein
MGEVNLGHAVWMLTALSFGFVFFCVDGMGTSLNRHRGLFPG